MTRTRSAALGFLTLSATAVLALGAAGGASAAPAGPHGKDTSAYVGGTLESTGAAGYWTEERMRNAIPGDVLAAKALERATGAGVPAVEKGKDKKVKPAKGKLPIAVAETPVPHVGKVFVSLPGGDFVCSGNALESANGSVVATAAHCLSDGPGVRPAEFIFVPAYENGQKLYGEWTAASYHLPQEWDATGSMKYDTGFVVVGLNEGKTLTEAVGGGSKPLFDGPEEGRTYKAFGYPSAKPFDGQTLWSCSGTANPDTTNPQFGSKGIPCDMTGGSSGGPWLIQGNDPLTAGYQNSVNSYGYKGADVMYGPTWGTEIEAAFTSASQALAPAPVPVPVQVP